MRSWEKILVESWDICLVGIVIVSNLALSKNDGPEMGVYHLVQSSIRVDYSIALLSDPKSKIMGG